MDFSFYPWGNAYYNTSKCGQKGYNKEDAMYCWIRECGGDKPPNECFNATSSPMLCQHGANECLANRIEACSDYLLNGTDGTNFTICFEGMYDSSWLNTSTPIWNAASQCALLLNIAEDDLFKCTKTKGWKLDQSNARATAQYGPTREGTPWVVVGGAVLDDPSTQLLGAVCSNYTGPSPKGCKGFV
mmetsp:Transcript_15492/g.30295  ORF Transcript_15492/g.30295 Transcript_15492/m.30295 type:complete len:187 (-) Transcript_15492:67-627(-)